MVTSIFNSFLSYLVITAKPGVWWYNDGKNAFTAGDTPSPHSTPLDAFGASIIAPSALATWRLDSPLLCRPNKSLNYTTECHRKHTERKLALTGYHVRFRWVPPYVTRHQTAENNTAHLVNRRSYTRLYNVRYRKKEDAYASNVTPYNALMLLLLSHAAEV